MNVQEGLWAHKSRELGNWGEMSHITEEIESPADGAGKSHETRQVPNKRPHEVLFVEERNCGEHFTKLLCQRGDILKEFLKGEAHH